jgi:hypothetical protein
LAYCTSLVGLAHSFSLDATKVGGIAPDTLMAALRTLDAVNPELTAAHADTLDSATLDNAALFLSNMLVESAELLWQLKCLLHQLLSAMRCALARQALTLDFPTQFASILLGVSARMKALFVVLETMHHLQQKVSHLVATPRPRLPHDIVCSSSSSGSGAATLLRRALVYRLTRYQSLAQMAEDIWQANPDSARFCKWPEGSGTLNTLVLALTATTNYGITH